MCVRVYIYFFPSRTGHLIKFTYDGCSEGFRQCDETKINAIEHYSVCKAEYAHVYKVFHVNPPSAKLLARV